MKFPRIDIDLKKISHNVRSIKKLYGSKRIEIIGVTKLICGDPELASVLVKNGIQILADSRIANIKRMKESGIKAKFMLLRSPAWSEINETIANVDISLNTEIIVLRQLSKIAVKNNVIHKVILMIEMGDLREGIMPYDIDAIVKKVIKLKGLFLIGIGTNLACFNGEEPNAKKMDELSLIASHLERKFDINLAIISGGNSSNYYWFVSSKTIGRVNNLRIGESFFLGTEPIKGNSISNLYTDAFILVAEVIESKIKPPKKNKTKKQITKRIIVAIGEQDVLVSGIFPIQSVLIIGASSDHLVLGCNNCNLNIGDTVSFNLNYKALLRVFNSKYVIRNIIN
ncbi:alanine/ornithine racemase family PLP-dependent enzyme [Tenacibaculum aiptasiae]|uniref:alanine/ornithine racemase family PLP-dependent enzyme n=1 Tax=Tenacibaculum aiptasiae TaxID=426481 RepID=UPI00232B4266|nr:alanine/ornithine racemase family PLP-dependent enzyme [Tenacibaculum aiptasiae]